MADFFERLLSRVLADRAETLEDRPLTVEAVRRRARRLVVVHAVLVLLCAACLAVLLVA